MGTGAIGSGSCPQKLGTSFSSSCWVLGIFFGGGGLEATFLLTSIPISRWTISSRSLLLNKMRSKSLSYQAPQDKIQKLLGDFKEDCSIKLNAKKENARKYLMATASLMSD